MKTVVYGFRSLLAIGVAFAAVADIGAQGFEPVGNTPEEFAAYIKAEIAKWAKVIRTAGIRAE